MTPRGGEPSVIVHSEYADLGGKFSRLSHAYDTKEAIFEDKNVLLEPCKLCGGVVYIWYSEGMRERLQEKNICFSCDFWESVHAEVQRKGTKKIIVEGSAYHISKDTPGDYFKGHGGRRSFRIIFGTTATCPRTLKRSCPTRRSLLNKV